MVENLVTVVNETGLHARPASEFVSYAKSFKGNKISLVKDGKVVNAKSILHLLSLSLKKGDQFTIRVEGDPEQETLDKMIKFVQGLEE